LAKSAISKSNIFANSSHIQKGINPGKLFDEENRVRKSFCQRPNLQNVLKFLFFMVCNIIQ
jgi:hypothetical protein